MSKLQPYKHWTRDEFYLHFMKQARIYGYDPIEIKEMVYDKRWNPALDFNGCNLVQDILHPFYACGKHDYDWIVGTGGLKADKVFYNNLKKAGMNNFKSRYWFYGVRMGWLLWFKWKK